MPKNTKVNKKSKSKKEIRLPRGTVSTSTGMFKPMRNIGQGGVIPNLRMPGRRAARRIKNGGANLPPLVSAYIDPFDEEASGVRYPDEFRGFSSTATMTYTSTMNTPMAFTDVNMAAGNAGAYRTDTSLCMYTPDPSNCQVNGVTSILPAGGFYVNAPNTWLWPNGIVFTGATASANAFGPGTGIIGLDFVNTGLIPFRDNYNACRLVAGGVKITSAVSFTNISGTIHLAPVLLNTSYQTSNNIGVVGQQQSPVLGYITNSYQSQLPASLSDMAVLPGYCQYAMSSLETGEITALFQRVGNEALLFKNTESAWGMTSAAGTPVNRTGNDDNPDTYGHMGIIVYVDGYVPTAGAAPANTPILNVEIRNHFECHIKPNSLINTTLVLGYNQQTNTNVSDVHRAAPHQPLLLAAADNLAADIPAIRMIDEAGVEESSFMQIVSNCWSTATKIASGVAAAVDVVGPLLAALIL